MQTQKIIIVVALCVMALALSINLAQAATAKVATLTITDADGIAKVVFDSGERVYMHWTADGTVNIKVTFDDTGEVVFQWTNQPSSGSLNFVPPYVGYYTVDCTGAKAKLIAVGTFFVVPESILGTLMATVVGFSAFGIVKLNHKVRRNN